MVDLVEEAARQQERYRSRGCELRRLAGLAASPRVLDPPELEEADSVSDRSDTSAPVDQTVQDFFAFGRSPRAG